MKEKGKHSGWKCIKLLSIKIVAKSEISLVDKSQRSGGTNKEVSDKEAA